MRKYILGALALGAAVLVSSGCGDTSAASPTYDSTLDTASQGQQAGRNQDLDAITSMLNERAQQKFLPGSEITIDVLRGRPAFNASDAGRALAAKGRSIYAEVGGQIAVSEVRTGGGSDAAYAALSGKPVLESMGLPGVGYHTNSDEYIVIDAIPRRLYLGARMIMDLSLGR